MKSAFRAIRKRDADEQVERITDVFVDLQGSCRNGDGNQLNGMALMFVSARPGDCLLNNGMTITTQGVLNFRSTKQIAGPFDHNTIDILSDPPDLSLISKSVAIRYAKIKNTEFRYLPY